MKYVLTTLAFMFATQIPFTANASTPAVQEIQQASLDGKSFCREVSTGGMFGQPVGVRNHCVSFDNGTATDNANTFFGNPPEHFEYIVQGVQIVNATTGEATSYDVAGDTLVIRKTGAVLTLK